MATADSSGARRGAYCASSGVAGGSDVAAAAVDIADAAHELLVNAARTSARELAMRAGVVACWRSAELADSYRSCADDIVPEFWDRCWFL